MQLETIVRPVQSPNVLSSRRVVSYAKKQPVNVARIEWGDTGELPAAVEREKDEDTGISFKVIDCDDKFTEANRTTEPIKITQEGNENNFVVFDRIKSIAFQKKEKPKNFAVSGTASVSYDKGKTSHKIKLSETTGGDATDHYTNVVVDESKLCKSDYKLDNKAGAPASGG